MTFEINYNWILLILSIKHHKFIYKALTKKKIEIVVLNQS